MPKVNPNSVITPELKVQRFKPQSEVIITEASQRELMKDSEA